MPEHNPSSANPPRDKAKPAAPVKRPPGGEGIGVGDQVYVRHPKRGAIAVKVTAVGKDGFRAVDGEGLKHAIRHAHYLGHRARMLNRYRLVEQGADGALIEDSSGRRRFVAGEMVTPEEPEAPVEDNDDPLTGGMDRLEKAMPIALPDDARLLMLKAFPPPKDKGKPDADKDKAGKGKPPAGKGKPAPGKGGSDFGQGAQAGKDGAAPMKHGDRVKWRHGDVEGSGRIVASGADGITAQADDGREHQVRHEHLVGPDEGGAGAGAGGGAARPAGAPGGGAGAPPRPAAGAAGAAGAAQGAAPPGAPGARPPGQPMAPAAPGSAAGGMEAAAAKVGAAIGQALLLFFKQAAAGGGVPPQGQPPR